MGRGSQNVHALAATLRRLEDECLSGAVMCQLRRICVGRALDPHMDHDPVARSECPVAYCIAAAALEEGDRKTTGSQQEAK